MWTIRVWAEHVKWGGEHGIRSGPDGRDIFAGRNYDFDFSGDAARDCGRISGDYGDIDAVDRHHRDLIGQTGRIAGRYLSAIFFLLSSSLFLVGFSFFV